MDSPPPVTGPLYPSEIEEHFETAEDFLKFLTFDKRFHPVSLTDSLRPGANGFIFRGQTGSDRPLVPTAHRARDGRLNAWLWEYSPQPPGNKPNDRRRYLGDVTHEEWHNVLRFIEAADELGLPTPIDYEHFKTHRGIIYRLWNAQEGDESYKEVFPSAELLPVFALAQHHGVPTRLLDWTESPRVAAYFAAFGASSLVEPERRAPPDSRISVIMLNVSSLKEEDGDVSLVYAPRHNNGFLRAQRGIFTLIPRANEWFYKNGEWPSLNDLLFMHLGRLTLPASQADALLRLLHDLDITQHHLMPTLDHASQVIPYRKRIFP